MSELANYIVYIAGICAAIYGIYSFVVRPIKWSKQKKEEMDEEQSKKISDAVTAALAPIQEDLDEVGENIDSIKQINIEQNEKLVWMRYATLDLLRQEIMYLYNHHFDEKKLTVDENTQLHKLYKDYKDGGGNSFIDDLVSIMSTWSIIPNKEKCIK